MKKFFLIFALIAWPFLAQAQEWVLRDSVGTRLDATDIDTILYVFPSGPLPKMMASDTTKAGVTAFLPPQFVRMSGDFDLWLDRSALAGVADSFRVWIKSIDPFTGRPARNDSTFILATASTFSDFTSTSRFPITLPAAFGFAIMLQQADVDSANIHTRVVTKISYSQ